MKADKETVTRLLKTARGQLDGLLKMVEEDRYLSLIHIFTADGLAALLQEQGTPVGKATIYRYLEALVEQGMVRKYVMEGASACYQYIDAASACAQHG